MADIAVVQRLAGDNERRGERAAAKAAALIGCPGWWRELWLFASSSMREVVDWAIRRLYLETMDDRQEGTLDQLRGALRTALPGLDTVAKDAIISALAPELRSDAAAPVAERRGINKSLGDPNVYYAIRAEDLKLIEQCAPIAVALYAILTNPVSVIGALVVLLFRYRRHRIRLDGRQALILKTLAGAGSKGLTLNELCGGLPVEGISPDDVATTLNGLASVKKENNDFVALVVEHDGRWYAKDL